MFKQVSLKSYAYVSYTLHQNNDFFVAFLAGSFLNCAWRVCTKLGWNYWMWNWAFVLCKRFGKILVGNLYQIMFIWTASCWNKLFRWVFHETIILKMWRPFVGEKAKTGLRIFYCRSSTFFLWSCLSFYQIVQIVRTLRGRNNIRPMYKQCIIQPWVCTLITYLRHQNVVSTQATLRTCSS